jgi:hypothetical protein
MLSFTKAETRHCSEKMKRQPAVRKWGEFDDERCPVCGKFVSDGPAEPFPEEGSP